MKPAGWVLFVVLAYVAASVDQAVAATQLFGGAAPECLTAVCLSAALLVRPAGGAMLGFLAGFAAAAISGAGMVSTVVTRVLAGFGLSMVKKAQVEESLWGSVVMVGAGVLASRVLQVLLTTPPDGLTQVLLSPVSALLSAALALPVYALFRRSAAVQNIGFQ